MGAGILISMEEYLNTSYSPDREYVDGAVVERPVGEIPHGIVQSNVVFALRRRYPGFRTWPEVRVRTVAGRCRIADVLVGSDRPRTAILESPPLIVVEILSASDEMTNVIEKLREYNMIGVPNIWVLDPQTNRAFTFEGNRLEEVLAGELVSIAPEIRLSLAEVFQDL
jgi:Uma2 family endonuclease